MTSMLKLPDNLTLDAFLTHYWQKRPLVMRQALVPPTLPPDELAGLACEPGVESRIVIEKDGRAPWEVRYGPFDEEEFSTLPKSHWTLLVQDVDKHIPEVAELLTLFRFVPDWRIDDIMISYAADQGTVGPHTDAYDVFLIQSQGRRRWQIHTENVTDDDLIPGLDLRILKHFEAEQEWIMEPGDVLYLPPNLAHWGVALGECMTWSVGFRAPSGKEMAASWLESRLQEAPDLRYRDTGQQRPEHAGEITEAAIVALRDLVRSLMEPAPEAFAHWVCGFISETKEHLAPLPPETPVEAPVLAEYLRDNGWLHRHPATRMLFYVTDTRVVLAASGEVVEIPKHLLPLIHTVTDLAPGEGADFSSYAGTPEAVELLARLFNGGHLEVPDDDL